jgi:hypothetical protein
MGDDTTAAMAIPANCLYLFDFRHMILLNFKMGKPKPNRPADFASLCRKTKPPHLDGRK